MPTERSPQLEDNLSDQAIALIIHQLMAELGALETVPQTGRFSVVRDVLNWLYDVYVQVSTHSVNASADVITKEFKFNASDSVTLEDLHFVARHINDAGSKQILCIIAESNRGHTLIVEAFRKKMYVPVRKWSHNTSTAPTANVVAQTLSTSDHTPNPAIRALTPGKGEMEKAIQEVKAALNKRGER